MSKKGKGRRSREQRLEARERRSSVGYLQRIQREVVQAQAEGRLAIVSETEEPK